MPPVFLISTIRSNSVAIARAFERTGRFGILHEPFVPVYDRAHYPELTRDWFRPSAFETPEQIVQYVRQRPGDVLVKDMAFAVAPYRDRLLTLPDARFILSARRPLDVFVSLYHKCRERGLPPDVGVFRDVAGYRQLLDLAAYLAAHRRPVLVSPAADCLSAKVAAMFGFAGLRFDADCTCWPATPPAKSHEERARAWGESKRLAYFIGWHREALDSLALKESATHDLGEVDSAHRAMITRLCAEAEPLHARLRRLATAAV